MDALSIIVLFGTNLVLLSVITALAFFIPGNIVTSRFALSRFQHIVLATTIGLVLWGWQGWIFGLLSMRWLSYVYLIICLFFWIKNKLWKLFTSYKSKSTTKNNLDKISILIIMTGMIFMIHNGFFNGVTLSGDIIFSGAVYIDQLWHAGLTNELVKSIPPNQPMMANVTVDRYHIWGDMIAADLVRVFNMPVLMVLFQYFSIFLTLFLGLNLIVFTQLAKLSRYTKWLLLFLFYFGGDISSYVFFGLGKGFHFRIGALETGSAFLANYPRAFGTVVAICGLSMILLWLKSKKIFPGIIVALIFASVIGFKTNIGLVFGIGLGVLGLYFLITNQYKRIIPLIIFVLLAMIVYLPINSKAGGLVYTGFWRTEDFIVHKEWGMDRLELARRIFAQDNKWLKVLFFDVAFLLFYMVTMFGVKLIGFIQTPDSMRLLKKELHIVLIPMIISGLIIGIFFFQEIGGANSIYFSSNSFIFLSIYTALIIGYWRKKFGIRFGIIAFIIVIFFSVPRSIYETFTNYNNIGTGNYILVDESQRNLIDHVKANSKPDEMFLSGTQEFGFLTMRAIFLGEGNGYNVLQTHDVDTTHRKNIVDTIYSTTDARKAAALFCENNIDYFLGELKVTDAESFSTKIYDSDGYTYSKINGDICMR